MNIFKKALLVVLGAGLVVVPSTVDKVEEVNAASAIPTGTVLYFDPQSSWESDGARMAAYFFGNGDTWASMTKVSGTGYYKVTAPSGGYTNFIFVRMNPNVSANNWNNNWGVQTADLALSGTNNLYTIQASYNNKWGTLASAAGKWTTYYEYDLVLNYNYEGSTNKTVDVKAGPNTIEIETPSREGYNFLGWSTSSTATEGQFLGTYTNTFTSNVTLYAVWEEQAADDCTVTYVVNGHEYVVPGAKVGESILNYVPTDRIALNNLVAIEWDNEGALTGDTVVNATKYYTTFDEVKGELNFSYSYSSSFVVFQVNSSESPTVTGYCSLTDETSEPITMDKEVKNSDGKTEFSAFVDTKYDKLTFKWGTTESFTTDRDYDKNAIWYNSATENGTWHYDGETKTNKRSSDLAVTNVSDMKLRVGTLAMAASGFAGVETYGIRIAKGNTIADDNYYGPTWAASDVAKVDANGNADEAGEYIRWNAVINNIPTDNYNDTFTAVAYVVIDGVSYDICKARTVSVVSLASGYTTSLSGIPQRACQFIVDTYKA